MRARIVLIVVVVLIVAAVIGWRLFYPGPMAFAGGSTVALADYHGANPTGVPATLANADQVKRGEYLARAADCMVCHTAPGGSPICRRPGFSAAVRDDSIRPISRPTRTTGIGNYSDRDFLNAVQQGIRRDGARLYPAMPYPSYTYMTDADALAIKAYLFSLPAVHADNRR